MVGSFIVRNLTTQDQVSFGQDSSFDFVFNDGDIDWGSVPASHSSYNYPQQVGVSIYASTLKERDISLGGWVFYTLSESEKVGKRWKERVEFAYERIKEKKDILSGLFNPSDFVRITIGGYFIEGKPSSSIIFGNTEADNNHFFCKFTVPIYCNNPMFKKEVNVLQGITGDAGSFHFPFYMPPNGFIFGTRINYMMIELNNEGNVKIGGKITIKAKGEVVKPTITNATTGESFTINKTLVNGEYVIVNTLMGDERGVVGKIPSGLEMNYLRYWSFKNSWLQFAKGISMIGYSCENQKEDDMEVIIEINPEKFNLEEM